MIGHRWIRSLNYGWRVLATGWCFLSFSLGGLALSITAFPLLTLFVRNADRRRDACQWVIHQSFRLFIGQMCWLGVMSVELHGAEKLATAGRTLVLANHPTLIDVVLIISLMPRADCIVKETLWRHLGFGGTIRAAGYIPNTGPEALVAACTEQLNKQRPIILFPEGTRSQPGMALQFQRGVAHIALAADCEILPVLLHCTPLTLTKSMRWYQIPDRRFHIRLDVLPSRRLSDFSSASDGTSLTARSLTRALLDFFNEELHYHAST